MRCSLALCITPKRCCTSIITNPKFLNCTTSSIKACVPIKILKLSDEKIFEVNTAIEKQFGIIDVLYNPDHAFELVEQIETLEYNIKTKKIKPSFLSKLLDSKQKELANYCKKYNKNKNLVVKNYEKTREFVPVIIGG